MGSYSIFSIICPSSISKIVLLINQNASVIWGQFRHIKYEYTIGKNFTVEDGYHFRIFIFCVKLEIFYIFSLPLFKE